MAEPRSEFPAWPSSDVSSPKLNKFLEWVRVYIQGIDTTLAAHTLATGHGDVTISSPAEGNYLRYYLGTLDWRNVTPTVLAGDMAGLIPLNDIADPDGSKTFNMTTYTLKFLWTNPAGNPLELEASGAYTGALLHIHQHTGNPGAAHLVEIASEDADIHHIHSTGPAATTNVLETQVTGDANPRFRLAIDGKMEWGGGTLAVDTNLYRSAADVLRTDDALYIGDGSGTIGVWPFFISDTSSLGWKVADSGGAAKFELYVGWGGTNQMRLLGGVTLMGWGQALIMGNQSYPTMLTLATDGDIDIMSSAALIWNNDTNLYRSALNTLKTDDNFVVSGQTNVVSLYASGVIYVDDILEDTTAEGVNVETVHFEDGNITLANTKTIYFEDALSVARSVLTADAGDDLYFGGSGWDNIIYNTATGFGHYFRVNAINEMWITETTVTISSNDLILTGGDITLDNNTSINFEDAGAVARQVLTVDAGDNLILGNSAQLDDMLLDVATGHAIYLRVGSQNKLAIASTYAELYSADLLFGNNQAIQFKNAASTNVVTLTVNTGDDLLLGSTGATNFDDVIIRVADAHAIYFQNATGNMAWINTSQFVIHDRVLTVDTNGEAGSCNVYLTGQAAQYRAVQFASVSSLRMQFGLDNAAESGGDVGSDVGLWVYSDAAVYIARALTITRATGAMIAGVSLAIGSGQAIADSDAIWTGCNNAETIAESATVRQILIGDGSSGWSTSGPAAPLEYLRSNAGNTALEWSTLAFLTASGTPLDGEVAVWTGATDLEGSADFTWDDATKLLALGASGGAGGIKIFASTGGIVPIEITEASTSNMYIDWSAASAQIGWKASDGLHIWNENATFDKITIQNDTGSLVLDEGDWTWSGGDIYPGANGTLDIGKTGAVLAEIWVNAIKSDGNVTCTPGLLAPGGLAVGVNGAISADRLFDIDGPLEVASAYGMVCTPTFNTEAITFGRAAYFRVTTENAAFTCPNAYGIFIDTATKGAASTITNLFGLYISAQTGGGTNWAIYVAGGNSKFVGDIYPGTDSTYDLGSTNQVWAEGWFDAIKSDGNISMTPSAIVNVIGGITYSGTLSSTGTTNNPIQITQTDDSWGFVSWHDSVNRRAYIGTNADMTDFMIAGENGCVELWINALDVVPGGDSTLDIGKSGAVWAEVWADKLTSDNAITISTLAGDITLDPFGADVLVSGADLVIDNTFGVQIKNAAGTAPDALTVNAGDDLLIGSSGATNYDDVYLAAASGHSMYFTIAGVTELQLAAGFVVVKDGGQLQVDTINEATAAAGVTAELVKFEDGNITFMTGGTRAIYNDIGTSLLTIAGGSSTVSGANIRLYGQTATPAFDMEFRAGTDSLLYWDESEDEWLCKKPIEFQKAAYTDLVYDNGTTSGAKTISCLNGNLQKVLMGGAHQLSWTFPEVGVFLLCVQQGATKYTPTWSGVDWGGRGTPVAADFDINTDTWFTFIYTGSEMHGFYGAQGYTI